MIASPTLNNRVAELRSAFDKERAARISIHAEEQMEDLLAIRISNDYYALRVSETSGLTAGKKIVALPSPVPELLGVTGVRGLVVPVYSVAILLGYGAENDGPRWLALCGKEDCIALAFGDLEGYLRIPRGQVFATGKNDGARAPVTHVAREADMVRAIVSIPILTSAIRQRGSEQLTKGALGCGHSDER